MGGTVDKFVYFNGNKNLWNVVFVVVVLGDFGNGCVVGKESSDYI